MWGCSAFIPGHSVSTSYCSDLKRVINSIKERVSFPVQAVIRFIGVFSFLSGESYVLRDLAKVFSLLKGQF